MAMQSYFKTRAPNYQFGYDWMNPDDKAYTPSYQDPLAKDLARTYGEMLGEDAQWGQFRQGIAPNLRGVLDYSQAPLQQRYFLGQVQDPFQYASQPGQEFRSYLENALQGTPTTGGGRGISAPMSWNDMMKQSQFIADAVSGRNAQSDPNAVLRQTAAQDIYGGAEGAEQQRNLVRMLALQRPGTMGSGSSVGGMYGGRLGRAISGALNNLYQERFAAGTAEGAYSPNTWLEYAMNNIPWLQRQYVAPTGS